MKQFVDIQTWERKSVLDHFRKFQSPDYSVTVQVECGNARENAKLRNRSFFIYYLYAILRAANEIKEFRYRMENGKVALYDRLDEVTTITVGDDGQFVGIRIPYHENFEDFYTCAQQIIQDASNAKDVHLSEEASSEEADLGLILLSALPGLHFTSMTSTQMTQSGCLYPLLSVGQAIQQEGKNYLPVAITVNHTFIDGFHLTEFYKKTKSYLLNLI